MPDAVATAHRLLEDEVDDYIDAKADMLKLAEGFDVHALAAAISEKFEGLNVVAPQGDPRDPVPPPAYEPTTFTHIFFSRPFEHTHADAARRGIRNLAARVRRFIERYVPAVGYVVGSIHTYCDAHDEGPPYAQIFMELVRESVAEKYSRRERRHKNWWRKPPQDHDQG